MTSPEVLIAIGQLHDEIERLTTENEKLKEMVARYVDIAAMQQWLERIVIGRY